MLLVATTGALFMAAAGPAGAYAKPCPNASSKTVAATPSYMYTRGCIASFDGTAIVYNLFEPLHPARDSVYPIVFGVGWGGAGATRPDKQLIADGYAELTWDPRGFGQSGGVSEFDAPSAEGRDVSALISKVLTGRPEIATDHCGQGGQPSYANDTPSSNSCGKPAVGMTGGSYGGAIQFATAAFDRRVKAIVPVITWNDLNYSLWPGGVVKLAYLEGLYREGLKQGLSDHVQGGALGGTAGLQTGGYDPNIHHAEVTGTAFGYPDQQMLSWFGQRSMSVYGAGPAGQIAEVPTLLIQGTVDTLFNLNDAWNNYVEIKRRYPDLPVKLIAFCGGHVFCPTGYRAAASSSSPVAPGESASTFYDNERIVWFDHYLRGSESGDGMPDTIVYQDQTGNFHPLSTFPTPSVPGPARYAAARLSGTLVDHGVPTGVGSGFDAQVTDGATAPGDPGQVRVPVLTAPAQVDVPIVGIGHVSADAAVDGGDVELFFRLIDKRTGRVVDCQTEPLRVHRPGGKISLDLAGTAYDLPAGDTLELQVSTSTDTYSPNRGAAVVRLANGTVSVPTLTGPPAPATQGLLAPVPQGSASEAGATGAEASQGQTRRHRASSGGSPGRGARVTCAAKRLRTRTASVTCAVVLADPIGRTHVGWRLLRRARTVARGLARGRGRRLELRFRALRPGRYTLRIDGWRRGIPIVVG